MKLLIEQNEDGGKRRNAAKKKELEATEKRIAELSAIPPLPPAIFSLVNVLSTLRHIGSSLTMYLTAYFTCISRFDGYSWHKCAETEYNYHAYL